MPVKLLIGTPCYGGLLHANYLHSLLNLSTALRDAGVGWELMTTTRESLITRARNAVVATFLGRSEFTHLLFIDSDIGFQPEAVLRMIEFDKPITATAYPLKGINWEDASTAAKNQLPPQDVERAALGFAYNLFDDTEGEERLNPVQVEKGFVRVKEAATGLMMIKREVFSRLMERFPEDRYVNDVKGYANKETEGNFWLFFETMKHPVTGRYLSEDYAFCHKWVYGCGGEIWLNVTSDISHIGPYEFRGRAVDPKHVKQPEPVG